MFTPIQLAFMKGFLYALGRQKKKLAQDDAKWITVHPNGQTHKGRPALIDTASGEVLGGMGGKFNGRHISAVKRGHEQAGAQMNVNRMNHKADMMNGQKIEFTNKEKPKKTSSIAKPEGYEERKKAREASLKRRADLAQQHADTMQRKVEEAGKKWDDEWQHQKETGREFGQPNVAGRMNSAQNTLQRKQDAYMSAKQDAEKVQYRADNLKHANYKIKGSGERARGDLQDRIYNNQVKKQEFLDAAKALSKAKTLEDFKNISKSLTISSDNSELKSYINDSIDHEINNMANARNGYAHEYIGSVENAIKGQIAGLKAKASQIQTLIRKDQKRFETSQANSSVTSSGSSFKTRLGDVSFAKNNKGESLAVLKTNGIPSKEDRVMLKSRRFRWNPDLKAWTVKASEEQGDFIKNFIG